MQSCSLLLTEGQKGLSPIEGFIANGRVWQPSFGNYDNRLILQMREGSVLSALQVSALHSLCGSLCDGRELQNASRQSA
jgi:hypothetical protein